MGLNRFSLGEPSRYDVESAAKLYLEYETQDLMSPELGQMFAMQVDDFQAVYDRAISLKKQAADSGA